MHVITALFKLLFMAVIITGCMKGKYNKAEFDKYINDPSNRLIKTIERKDLKIKISYYPYQNFVLQEIKSGIADKQMQISSIHSLDSLYGRYDYVMVSISNSDENNQLKYPERALVKSLNSICMKGGMDTNIYLEIDQKEPIAVSYLSCQDFGGIGTEYQVLLAFDGQKQGEKLRIHIEGLYDQAGDAIEFKRSDIKNIPVLDYGI